MPIMTVKDDVEYEQIERLKAWRAGRDAKAVKTALDDLRARRRRRPQHHGAVDRRGRAGVTTGEWGETLRAVFGEYRAANRRCSGDA